MNAKDFLRLGVPLGEATRRATDSVSRFILGGGEKTRLQEEVKAIIANPSAFVRDPLGGPSLYARSRSFVGARVPPDMPARPLPPVDRGAPVLDFSPLPSVLARGPVR